VDYLLWDDCSDDPYHDDAYALMKDVPNATVVDAIAEFPRGTAVYQQSAGRTRGWSQAAWRRQGEIKNRTIQHFLRGTWDSLWLVDADVLCEPTTMNSLIEARAPIVAGVYWTHWQRPSDFDALDSIAQPQVWLRHPYHLDGRGWTAEEFRGALINRQLVQVWGLGACTLFQRGAIEKGVHFGPVDNLPPEGMGDGEDRHLSWLAEKLHVGMFADAWPNIYHAYHPQDHELIPDKLEALARSMPTGSPTLLDQVNLRITNLDAGGGPKAVRGVLGQIGALPEIVDAVTNMQVGNSVVTKVRFPVHWNQKEMAGRSFVMNIELIDWRHDAPPPVVDSELLQSSASVTMDLATLTRKQVDEVI